MKQHRLVAMGTVLLGLIFIYGCPVIEIGGIGQYDLNQSTGYLAKDYPKSMQDTWNAVLTVAKSDMYKFEITSQEFGAQKSTLNAIQPARPFLNERQNVSIELVAKSDQVTTVKVKFGDPSKENPLAVGLWGSPSKEFAIEFHGQVMKIFNIPTTIGVTLG